MALAKLPEAPLPLNCYRTVESHALQSFATVFIRSREE